MGSGAVQYDSNVSLDAPEGGASGSFVLAPAASAADLVCPAAALDYRRRVIRG